MLGIEGGGRRVLEEDRMGIFPNILSESKGVVS